MKRRGFLAAFAALPFVPFAPKGAFAEGGRITSAMFKVGSAGPELEISPGYPLSGGRFDDGHGKLPPEATESTMVNPHALVLRAAEGPVASIRAYDGHAALTLDRDYATGDELFAATGRPGRYATCLAEGLWRPFGSFNGKPAFAWGAASA